MLAHCIPPPGQPDKEPYLYQALRRLRMNKFTTKYRGQVDGELLGSEASVDTILIFE